MKWWKVFLICWSFSCNDLEYFKKFLHKFLVVLISASTDWSFFCIPFSFITGMVDMCTHAICMYVQYQNHSGKSFFSALLSALCLSLSLSLPNFYTKISWPMLCTTGKRPSSPSSPTLLSGNTLNLPSSQLCPNPFLPLFVLFIFKMSSCPLFFFVYTLFFYHSLFYYSLLNWISDWQEPQFSSVTDDWKE